MKLILLTIGLLLLTFSSVDFVVRHRHHDWALQAQADAMTAYAASLQANVDYDHGLLRLYEVSDANTLADTGRRNGAFEIWSWPSYTNAGSEAHQTAMTFVDTYNTKMNFMVAHPEQFSPKKTAATQPATGG